MFGANVADEQGAVPLVQVAQQFGAALVAFVHNVRACLKDDRWEKLRVRLAIVPDSMDAPVWPDSRRVDKRAWDDHTGVGHGRNVTGDPHVPLATRILVGTITGEHETSGCRSELVLMKTNSFFFFTLNDEQ